MLVKEARKNENYLSFTELIASKHDFSEVFVIVFFREILIHNLIFVKHFFFEIWFFWEKL